MAHWKWFTAVPLTLVLALSIAACGNDDDADDPGEPGVDDAGLDDDHMPADDGVPGDDAVPGNDDAADDGPMQGDAPTMLEISDTLIERGEAEDHAACLAAVLINHLEDGNLNAAEISAWMEEEDPEGPVAEAIEEAEEDSVCPEAIQAPRGRV